MTGRAGSRGPGMAGATDATLRLAPLWLLAMVPLAVIKPGNDYVMHPKIVVAVIGIAALAALAALRGRLAGTARQPLAVPAAVLLVASALSSAGAVNVAQSGRLLAERGAWIVLALLVARLRPPFGRVLMATAASIAVQAAVAAMQLSGRWIIGHGEQFGPGRIYGTLGNPSFFGVYLAPLAVWLLDGMLDGVRRRRWGPFAGIGATLGVALWLMYQAAVIDAWAGFAVGGALAVSLRLSGRSRMAGAVSSVVLMGGALAAVVILGGRLEHRLDYLKVKAFSWHAAVRLWQERPVLGFGLGGYQTLAPKAMAGVHETWTGRWGVPETFVTPHDEAFAHQDGLQSLAETGVLGTGAFLWLLVVALRIGLSDPARAPYVGALAAFAPTMALHFPLHLGASAMVFWWCVGAAGGRRRPAERSGPPFGRGAAAAIAVLVVAAVFSLRALTANVYLGFGYRAFRAGAAHRAIPFFDRFDRLAPAHYEGAFYGGAVYQAVGDDARSIAHYQRALAYYPYMQGAIYNLANVYLRRGAYEQAIDTYTRALSVNSCMVEAINNRGNARALLGRHEEAELDYRRAVELKPDYAEALFNLSVGFAQRGRDAEALVWLKRALEADPEYPPAVEFARSLGLR